MREWGTFLQGDYQERCQEDRYLNLCSMFRYLGAFLEVDWPTFLDWVYDRRLDYDYPFHSEHDPIVIAPPEVGEVLVSYTVNKYEFNDVQV